MLSPAPASATLSVAEAESLVRARYFEGVPYARAREIPAAAVPRLAAMLEDPAEAAHHANVVMALGVSGHPGAFEAIAAFAADAPRGELDAAAYTARASIPIALGHLAAHDDRALEWLTAAARASGDPPEWSYGPLSGARLAAKLRADAIRGLGISGRPEAAAVLEALEAEQAGPPSASRAAAAPGDLSTQIRDALALHARVAREGARSVFGAPAGRTGETR